MARRWGERSSRQKSRKEKGRRRNETGTRRDSVTAVLTRARVGVIFLQRVTWPIAATRRRTRYTLQLTPYALQLNSNTVRTVTSRYRRSRCLSSSSTEKESSRMPIDSNSLLQPPPLLRPHNGPEPFTRNLAPSWHRRAAASTLVVDSCRGSICNIFLAQRKL